MSEEEVIDQPVESVEPTQGNGNFVAIFGKIFLSILAIGAQVYIGMSIMDNAYPAINEKIASFASSESVYHTMENIIVNPADADGKRYLLLTLALELNDSGAIAAIEKHNIKITDSINTILSHKTVEELGELQYRDAIKREIGLAINQILGKNSVQNLFFTKYVMQ